MYNTIHVSMIQLLRVDVFLNSVSILSSEVER